MGGPEDRGRPGFQRRGLRKPDELDDEPPPPPLELDELEDDRDDELDEELDDDDAADDDELDEAALDEDEELDVAELDDALEVADELDDDGVGDVGLSPVVQALVSTPTPANAMPPDNRRRKSRLSVRCRTSSTSRCGLGSCIANTSLPAR